MGAHEPLTQSSTLPIVYFGDRFVDIAVAQIPVTTHALHYGTAVFEGIRAYGDGVRAAIFRAHDHYERFIRNAAHLQMAPAHSVDELVALTVELLIHNHALSDVYIRPLLYNNSQNIGAGLSPDAQLVMMAVQSSRQPVPRPPVTAMISRWRRFPSASCPAGAKITGLYVNSSLARADAIDEGYDHPLLLTTEGMVSEGFGANLFAVWGNRVVTPPPDADILAGITRRTIIDHLARRDDLSVSEEPIAPDDLKNADELFFCGTGMEITPISSVDGQRVGDGGVGPLTNELARWYRAVVLREADAPEAWYTLVQPT